MCHLSLFVNDTTRRPLLLAKATSIQNACKVASLIQRKHYLQTLSCGVFIVIVGSNQKEESQVYLDMKRLSALLSWYCSVQSTEN